MPDARPRPRRPGERAHLVALPGGQASRDTPAGLPSEVSSFVGRQQELGEVIRILRTHRLVTLPVPGAVELRLPGTTAYAVDASSKVGQRNVTVDQDPASPHRIEVRTEVGAVTVAPLP